MRMKFENTRVYNIDMAIRGMRNSHESWDRSDSNGDEIGKADMVLAQKLIKAGSEHRKFLRQIFVSVEITAPMYYWAEFDTYKVGVTRNSTSLMHRAMEKEFTTKDFAIDDMSDDGVIQQLNNLRKKYIETKDIKFFWAIRQWLPASYLYMSTVTMNYENVLNMVHQRKNHRLIEWSVDFIEWVKDLPYAKEFFEI